MHSFKHWLFKNNLAASHAQGRSFIPERKVTTRTLRVALEREGMATVWLRAFHIPHGGCEKRFEEMDTTLSLCKGGASPT